MNAQYTVTFDSLKQRFKELIEKCPKDIDLEEQEIDNRHNSLPVLMFAGQIKAGKSRLINNLIGEKLLPDSRQVTDTRTYGRLINGKCVMYKAVMKNGEKRVLTKEAADSYLSKSGGEQDIMKDIERIEIWYPSKLLDVFAFEDSPGTGDIQAEQKFVRTDVLEKALHSTMVFYLIPGMVQEVDARFCGELIKHGVPLHIVFSRFDELTGDLQSLSEAVEALKDCNDSLIKWGIFIGDERLHRSSSYWYEKGGLEVESGIESIKAVIVKEVMHISIYKESQGARYIAAKCIPFIKRLRELIVDITEEHQDAEVFNELKKVRDIKSFMRKLGQAEIDISMKMTGAADELRLTISSALNQKVDIDIQNAYRNEWGPEYIETINEAITRFNEEINKLAQDYNLTSPASILSIEKTPSIYVNPPASTKEEVLKEKAEEIIQAAAESPGFDLFSGLGKVYGTIKQEIEMALYIKNTLEEITKRFDSKTQEMLLSAKNRIQTLSEEYMSHLEEQAEISKKELAHTLRSHKKLLFEFESLELEARNYARICAK